MSGSRSLWQGGQEAGDQPCRCVQTVCVGHPHQPDLLAWGQGEFIQAWLAGAGWVGGGGERQGGGEGRGTLGARSSVCVGGGGVRERECVCVRERERVCVCGGGGG